MNPHKALFFPFTDTTLSESSRPLTMVRGEGVRVYDTTGRGYIEGAGGLWCANLGFSERRLADASDRQMRKLPFYHLFGHKGHDVGIELASKLSPLLPIKNAKLFFATSGSEANETAVKIAWMYNNAQGRTNKKGIISRQRAYHGMTYLTGSLTGIPILHQGFHKPDSHVSFAPTPHYYGEAIDGVSVDDFVTRQLSEIENLIHRQGADSIAAFIAEPIQAAGGVIIPPTNYFPRLRKLLAANNILLIADEIVTGFGRTGEMFGSSRMGGEPDIITMAKGLTAGYAPLSAVAITEDIYEVIAKFSSTSVGGFFHGFTYSGHPVSSAIAIECLNIYHSDAVVSRVAKLAPLFQNGLDSIASESRIVGEARSMGLIGALDIREDPTKRTNFDVNKRVGAAISKRALEKGLIVRQVRDIIALCPPLTITREEMTEMFAILKAALRDVEMRGF